MDLVAQLSQRGTKAIYRLLNHCEYVWPVHFARYERWPGLIRVRAPRSRGRSVRHRWAW